MSLEPSPPDSKKKKPALPTFLSSLRNAQAVIGRAADDFHERETRPLAGSTGGGRVAAAPNQPQLRSAPPSASLSSSLNNFSQRFGSQFRKHSQSTGKGRRRKGHGVTGVPQSFYVAVLCVFFAFPIFFVVFILARHAVFGDESDNSVGKVHIHEVPSAFAIEPALEGAGGIREDQPPSIEGVANMEMIEETDPSTSAESAATDLQEEITHVPGEINLNQTVRTDESGLNEETAIDRHSSENTRNATGTRGENILALKEIKSSNNFKGGTPTLEQAARAQDSSFKGDTPTLEQAAKVQDSSHLVSTSATKEGAWSASSSDNIGSNAGESLEKKVYQDTLRGSKGKDV